MEALGIRVHWRIKKKIVVHKKMRKDGISSLPLSLVEA
jgi:hypothetical protein